MARIALGTVQFGLDYGVSNASGQTDSTVVAEILQMAMEKRVNLLDTAPVYGAAEALLGRLGTEGFDVVTKLPTGTTPEDVAETLATSLRVLGRDSLHGYIVHNPADLLGPRGAAVWNAMLAAREAGLVERIGASVSSPCEVADLMELYPLDLVQLPLNPIDARWEISGTLDALVSAGCDIHVRSVFLQGLLLMPSTPVALTSWAPQLDKWRSWCAASGRTPLAACLGHVLALPQVSRAVIGVTSIAQLVEALAVAPSSTPIPEDLRTCDPVLLNPAKWPS